MKVIDVMTILRPFDIKHYLFMMIKHFYQSDIMFNKTSLLSRNISEFNLSTLEIDSKKSFEQVIFLD